MPGSEWVYASLAVLLGVHLLTLAYTLVVRHRGGDGGTEAASAAGGEDAPAGVCRCDECGAENDVGYRFCRNCVAELPGTTAERPVGGRQHHPN